jgi:hypothetical protein
MRGRILCSASFIILKFYDWLDLIFLFQWDFIFIGFQPGFKIL